MQSLWRALTKWTAPFLKAGNASNTGVQKVSQVSLRV